MKKVVAIYTGHGLMENVKAMFAEQMPDCRLINIIDDSLIADVIAENDVSPAVTRRLLQYYQTAQDMGADVIFNTCSSVGDLVAVGQKLVDVPIVRIDEPMAREAVSKYQRIGVIATIPTTLDPTVRLLQEQAQLIGKEVSIVDGLADGAYQALVSGKPEEHDQRIVDVAQRLTKEVDAIVLAQGSMARMEKKLAEITGIPVLSSISRGVTEVKSVLESE